MFAHPLVSRATLVLLLGRAPRFGKLRQAWAKKGGFFLPVTSKKTVSSLRMTSGSQTI
jgi:hypothetical protein